MANNLRAKIPASDTLIVRDVNEDVMKRFAAEARETAQSNGACPNECQVEIAQNAREVAEKSVRGYLLRGSSPWLGWWLGLCPIHLCLFTV